MTRTHLALPGLLLAAACSTGKVSDTTGFSGASSATATAGSGTVGTAGSSGASAGSVGGSGSSGGAGDTAGASSTGGTMGSSTGGSSTGSASTGGGSTSGGLMCTDPNEPNETESNAKNLGIIDDCDGSGSSVSGQLEGASDVDWLTYSASDVFGCVVDPVRDVISSGNVRFCKFIDCASGTADVGCPGGAFKSTSPGGHPGCCKTGTNLGNFDVSVDCAGSDDSAQVYLRVDQGPPGVCTTYTIDYHF